MNLFLLHLLLHALSPLLKRKKIGIIRLLPPVLSIELLGTTDVRYLVVILSTPGPFCFLDSDDPTGGTGAEMFRRIRGAVIAGKPAAPVDRIIRLELSGERENTALAIYLFGSVARVRIESRETIVESLDPKETGRLLSQPRSMDTPVFASLEASELMRHFERSRAGEPVASGLTTELLECFAGPDGEIDLQGLLAFRDGLLEREGSFALGTRGRSGAASPLPATAADRQRSQPLPTLVGPFEDARLACQALGRFILASSMEDIVARHTAPLRKHLTRRERLLTTLQVTLSEAESYITWRNEATTLAAYQSTILPGASEVTLPDLYGPGETTTIKLDPGLPITDQIEKRFRKASKLDRSRQAVERRIRTIAEEITELTVALSAIRDAPSLGDAIRHLEKANRRHRIAVRARGAGRRAVEPRQYRRFDLDAHWFVLVGRNDRENDEITFRVAAPNDIWLHAQQTAGSHILLRPGGGGTPGNPPHHVLEAAAGIAAHFSKARHASLVPVIYTLRKYVRKFKGSRPGQVLCEREKTIFAEPKLPDAAPDV